MQFRPKVSVVRLSVTFVQCSAKACTTFLNVLNIVHMPPLLFKCIGKTTFCIYLVHTIKSLQSSQCLRDGMCCVLVELGPKLMTVGRN